jgi:chromosome segregation ATPase
MEPEEIEKRLEWLDSERQKDKAQIADLKTQIINLENAIKLKTSQISNLEDEVKQATTMAIRVEKYDGIIAQNKIDVLKQIADNAAKIPPIEARFDKQLKDDFDALNKQIAETRNAIPNVTDLRKSLQGRIEEEFRLGRLVEELQKKISDLNSTDEDLTRAQKMLTDEFHIDSKRVADLSLEVTSLRKRVEEERNRIEVLTESTKKYDVRINELVEKEAERQKSQMAFIDRQSLLQLDREKAWESWGKQIAEVEKVGGEVEAQLQSLETIKREVKNSQQEFEDVNLRLDRRINEITEIQRLFEERFHQDWVAFKADDQKRWTNYIMSQEEQLRDEVRQIAKLQERVVTLEDASLEVKDQIHAILEETENRIQSLVAFTGALSETFARAFGPR